MSTPLSSSSAAFSKSSPPKISHVLEVVEKVCRRVVILYRGKVVLQDSIENLKSSLNPDLQKVFASVTNQEDYAPIAQAIPSAVRQQ